MPQPGRLSGPQMIALRELGGRSESVQDHSEHGYHGTRPGGANGVASGPEIAGVAGLDLLAGALLLLRVGAQHLDLGKRLAAGRVADLGMHRAEAVIGEELLPLAREHEIDEQAGGVRVWR